MAVDRERLTERLAAVERRLTDADPDGDGLADVAAVEGRLSELESRADDLDDRLGDVESGLQALRGYVGGVDAVDESVERRADAALAKAEELEAMLVEDPDLAVERVPTDGHDASASDGHEDRAGRRGGNDDGPGGRERDAGAGRARDGDADGRPSGSPRAGPSDDPHPGPDADRPGTESADSDGGRLVDRIRDAL